VDEFEAVLKQAEANRRRAMRDQLLLIAVVSSILAGISAWLVLDLGAPPR
jgi:hypothetical protein